MRLIATAGRDRRLLDRYGPTAVITGASSGIGREIALQLAEAGFALVLVARREHLLADVATRVGNRVPVHVLPLDLTRPAAVENLATATADTDVGLCVAAAGFGTSGPFLGSDLQREEEMLRVNCAALLAQAHLSATGSLRGVAAAWC